MTVLIIEDEKLATERLKTILYEYDSSIQIVECLESIEETVRFLRHQKHPDVVLADIHLSDGHSFEIFKQVSYHKPVIFTTAFDQYAIEAFSVFSIDYIMKPVTLEALTIALNKFKFIGQAFSPIDFGQLLPDKAQIPYKNRFLVKSGRRLAFIDVSDISYFQADNKIVYLIDKDGNRFVIDYTMERLEQLVNPSDFFRLNRRYLVRINFIDQIKPFFNHRLRVVLKGQNNPDDMIISRERVTSFMNLGNWQ